jgi:hypothetical protein
MQKESNSPDIGNITLWFMVAVAIFFDALQFLVNIIPFLGWILSLMVDIFAFGTFALWFKFNKIEFTAKRNMFLGGGFLLEFIPLLNSVPFWTISIIIIALDLKAKKILPKSLSKAVETASRGFHR